MQRFALSTLMIALAFVSSAQDNILDMRENYSIGQVVTVSGIVTNGPELGSIRYIQDDFAGVAIYPGANWNSFFTPSIGDEITVTGEITEFNGLLEIGPDLTELILESAGNALPEPILITPNEMDESYEAQLVRINTCFFDNGGSVIAGNATQNFNSGGQQSVIYVRNGHPMVGEILPISPVDLVGIVSQFSFTSIGGYQLLPRTQEDFILDSSINLVTAVEQTDMTTTSFTLNWNTDVPGNSMVEYGLTPALGMTESIGDLVTTHSVPLSGLIPGEVYYARVSSSDGDGLAESGISPYVTVSESSGDIHVYFTGPVDHGVATDELAISIGEDTNDTIAEYINRAQHTLDIAVYNINNSVIATAINDAYERGVQIRYIAQGTNANVSIASFDPGIPVHFRNDDNGSGMHNKFMIVDADYPELATLLTGSTNWTPENLVNDPNNLIIFQDQSLAKGYRLEFEEMWGGDDVMPNVFESKFGAEKSVNTPRKYVVGGSPVEVHFSPTDNTTQAIEKAILSANSSFEFALLAFTRDDLGAAVIDRNNDFFCYVRGIIEQTSGTGNEYEVLVEEGVEVYSHEGVQNQLHHKYGIVDNSDPASDPQVITGSHNWSSSAENVNDENTVFVHDARVANLFFQEFHAILSNFVSVEEIEAYENLIAFPNPASSEVFIELGDWQGSGGIEFQLCDISGRVVKREFQSAQSLYTLNVSDLPAGMYTLTVNQDQRLGRARILVQ